MLTQYTASIRWWSLAESNILANSLVLNGRQPERPQFLILEIILSFRELMGFAALAR